MPAFTHSIETDAGKVVLMIRYEINRGYPGDGMTPPEYPFPEGVTCRFVSGAEEQEDGTILEQRGFSRADSEFKGRDYLKRFEDEINEAVERHFHERQDGLRGLSGGEG
jgi:hypothetical protein